MSFTLPFVLSGGPSVLLWLSPGEGWDAVICCGTVGINCKKTATTENQGAGVNYMG